jgi:hypothetical protein
MALVEIKGKGMMTTYFLKGTAIHHQSRYPRAMGSHGTSVQTDSKERPKVCSTPGSGMDRGYFTALCRGAPELEETNRYE